MTARLGIDLGGTKIEGVALDESGSELARVRIPTPAGDYEGIVKAVAGLVTRINESVDGSREMVGIGTPGAISPSTGLIKNSNSTALNGRPLDRDLREAMQRPLTIRNDADCFTLSEAIDGAATGAGTVFGVILGTGAGGGVVVNGDLVSGPNAIAGEWGHIPLPWPGPDELPGPDCYCGRRGCMEQWVSGTGFAADHQRVTGEEATAAEIAAKADAGDAQATASLSRYLNRLARGLAVVIDILDPEIIVLGGGMSNVDRIYAELPALLPHYVFSDQVVTRIVQNLHGDSSGVRGAAYLVA